MRIAVLSPVLSIGAAPLPLPTRLSRGTIGDFSFWQNRRSYGRHALVSQGEFSDVRLVMVGEYEREVFHSYFGTIKKQLELALTRVLRSKSLRQRMCTAGLAAARQLTWDAAARQMISLMQKVVAQ